MCILNPVSEAILLVDVNNAFNALNRQTAPKNITYLCQALATVLINSYRAESDLVVGNDVIKSREGTTQGDPLAMPMYTFTTVPLNRRLKVHVSQVWYADDAAAMGRIDQVRLWWDKLLKLHVGPGFGYYPNAMKTWLITKDIHLQKATEVFRALE